jgi:RHS repeat-associated protein
VRPTYGLKSVLFTGPVFGVHYSYSGTTKHYYYEDHLGSTRAVVTGSGTVVQAQDYDGWGVALPTRSYVSGVGVQEGYTGKERDAETGLDSFGARYYLSAIGRWAAVDPLAEVYPAWSPYTYVLDSPLRLVDPDGAYPTCGNTCDETYEAGAVVENQYGRWEYQGNNQWKDLATGEVRSGSELLSAFNALTETNTQQAGAGVLALGGALSVGARSVSHFSVSASSLPVTIAVGILYAQVRLASTNPAVAGTMSQNIIPLHAQLVQAQLYQNGSFSYHQPPRILRGFPDARKVRPKAG